MSPLKRREELRALSEDHHNALVIALRCRRVANGSFDAEPSEYWVSVREFFRLALEPHFEIEESLLLPALEQLGESSMCMRILKEHAALRALVGEEVPDLAGFDAFGTLLEEHIRYEERTVFEDVQDRLPQAALDEIAQRTRDVPQICPNTFRPIPRGTA
jgi:hemerythrin-like domain-containing protein